jgi:hemoglobin
MRSQIKLAARIAAVAVLAGLAFSPVTSGSAYAEEKSLYDRIGGYKGVAATVDDLVDRIYVNQTLNQNPALKAVHDLNERAAFKLILATWVMESTGGPKVYFGRPMDKAHSHLSITSREFDVIMHECKETFYKFNVPEKEMGELMTALQSFREKIVTAEAK